MALLANLSLKFQKNSNRIRPKLFIIKPGNQKYAEFDADPKTAEKDAIKYR
jgi:hypothetical protein